MTKAFPNVFTHSKQQPKSALTRFAVSKVYCICIYIKEEERHGVRGEGRGGVRVRDGVASLKFPGVRVSQSPKFLSPAPHPWLPSLHYLLLLP